MIFSKVLYVLSVTNKPFLEGVIRLNDVKLSDIMLSLVAPLIILIITVINLRTFNNKFYIGKQM
jgi:hypothetical protein